MAVYAEVDHDDAATGQQLAKQAAADLYQKHYGQAPPPDAVEVGVLGGQKTKENLTAQ
ncbi:MAG TPA: hypothetical protein VLP43_07725 [Solirubrobacteraceae bacterium]|nr:hypothetical protein [Solirubrobacteraceae bacterium]